MRPGTLLFFSNTVPIEESGSFIIFHRHLQPLVEAGWRLRILSYFPAPASGVFWEHIRLPRRLPWWPPVSHRSLLSQRLRRTLALHHLRRAGALDTAGPRVLLANLWDSQALFAAGLARRGFGRLGVFLHDDEITWNAPLVSGRYLRWCRADVTRSASRLWAVSDRLLAQLPASVRSRSRVLRPIAGVAPRRAVWRPEFATRLHLGYAGKIYSGLHPTLEQLATQLERADATLTIITDAATAARPPVNSPRLAWRPYFPRPSDAAEWLLAHCSALLIAHPSGLPSLDRGWKMLQTSFPSKLPEYAQLGLPLVLLGDRDSEFGDWAAAHHEPPFFPDASAPALGATLAALRTESRWRAAAAAVAALADGEFNPARTQAAFVSDLESLITDSP